MTAVLRRSLLYVPGSSDTMIRKAGARGADVLILDLEDGVHPDVKPLARESVAAYFETADFGRAEVFVRVNPPDSPWGTEDLAMVARLRPAGAVLPKVSDPVLVDRVDDRLGGVVPLYLMIETAAGVLAAPELARASPRVAGLVFGAADYRESLRAGRLPDELELYHARSHLLLAARSGGVEAFDTPWFDYRDVSGLERSARIARSMGFDGKTAIHPLQVPVINDVFSPTASEVERARRIAAVMREALERGRSVATLDGEMIEPLHLNGARRTLERAKALGIPVEDQDQAAESRE